MTLTLTRPKVKTQRWWTQEEIEIMKGKYDGTCKTIYVLEQTLKRSHQSIKKKAIELGLTKRRNYPVWSADEIAKLEELTPLYSPWKIAQMIGRSVNAVKIKQTHLKFSPTSRDWYTLRECAQILGIHINTLTDCAQSGKLRAEKYGHSSIWQITPQSLKLFVMKYPGELQGRKPDMVTLVDLLCNIKAVEK